MVTSKNTLYGNKTDFIKLFKMIKNSKASWFTKIMNFIVFPFIVVYFLICGLIQMIFYPVLYVVLTILYDIELREEVAYSIRKVWSLNYWF